MTKFQTALENFQALPNEQQRELTQRMIETVIAEIEANGSEPSPGQYDNLSAAMGFYRTGDFYLAVVSADRAQHSTSVQQSSDLFGISDEPDRSVALRSVWRDAQGTFITLNALANHDHTTRVNQQANMTYTLTLGSEVLFESVEARLLAQHLVEQFPPEGDFPSPNPHNAGFAIVLPSGERLQGLRAGRWVRQNR
jgi:hypothetical protein